MIGRNVLMLFLLPGKLVSDALGTQTDDDQAMIRSLIITLAVVL